MLLFSWFWSSMAAMAISRIFSFLLLPALCLAGCNNSSAPVQDKHATIQPSATAGVEIPPGFAAPKYPGSIAKFIYGPTDPTKATEDMTVILQTQDDAKTIAAFYQKELPKQGWKVLAITPTSEGINISASNATQSLKIEIADNVDSRMINLTVGLKK